MRTGCYILIAFLLYALSLNAQHKTRPDLLLINRVFDYAQAVDTLKPDSLITYSYKKFSLNVERRNVALLPVPTMYRIAHGPRRKYVAESYDKVTAYGKGRVEQQNMLVLSTFPHHKKVIPTLQRFLTPEIYSGTVIANYLLSPFNRANKHYYRYAVSEQSDTLAKISFRPKVDNTQLVSGEATVDALSGKVLSGYIEGELDMVSFHLAFDMRDDSLCSMLPAKCKLQSTFHFIGNKINVRYTSRYGLKNIINDTLKSVEDTLMMALVRPDTLTMTEKGLYKEIYHVSPTIQENTALTKKRHWAKHVFWDVLGSNLIQHITSSYGTNKQGYVKINPLFNPLYMGYSGRRGFYYKFDIRSSYILSPNSFLFARFKAGYSFKQRQFYFQLPVEYHYNRNRHGYVSLALGNGNWIVNGLAYSHALTNLGDTASVNKERLPYFKDFYLVLTNNYDISDRFSFQVGLVAHDRVAVEKATYHRAGMEGRYRSIAPMIELSYRPLGWKGPIINASYERSINGFLQANIAYEKWEADMQYILRMHRLRALSFRAGAGMYTLIDGANFFLDYNNFRENNIPGGWNDEWSGEFELLPAEWYNLSQYYIRGNLTYETPLLALSWLPWVGHFIEKERIYANALWVTNLHPYVEIGYGFTTRWASLGFFMANKNGRYNGFGVKIELELFRQW